MISKIKINVGIDNFLDLKMYRIPKYYLNKLKKKYLNVNFQPVNVTGKKNLYKNIDVYWGNRINKEIIKKAKKLKWIHFGSVGVERANDKEVKKRKILVTNSRGTMTDALVSSALAYITCLARNFHRIIKIKNAKNFNRKYYDNFFENISDVTEKNCFIAGMGEVGKKLALVCKVMGMNVNMFDNKAKFNKKNKKKLQKIVAKSDFVINLLPFTKETKNIFDKKILSKMKKKSFFINLGRGETVDEKYLIYCLKKNKIAGAGLDVFSKEPLSKKSDFFNLKNVIITPHIAGVSVNYWKKQFNLFDHNLGCFLNNKKKNMKNVVKKFF